MNKISSLFSKHWRNFNFVTLVIISLVIIIAHSSITPHINQAFVAVFYSPFTYLNDEISNLRSVADINEQLNQELNEKSLRLNILEEVALENDRLRSILGFEPPENYRLIPTKVMSVSGDIVPMSVIINKGSSDSIYIDQPVINQQGLIGRISQVMTDYATVQLLTDPANRVAARVVSSREMGIVKYNKKDGMVLDNFPIQGEIYAGDMIISSGLGGVYPPGLQVGEITEVVRYELKPFCDIKIKPAANFYSLEELFILKEVDQWSD